MVVNMMSVNMSSENMTIYYLSQELLPVYIPSIVYICIVMAIGLVGNIIVVVVFGFKMKKQSTYRHFILALAMYDLTACSIAMPGLVVEMGRPYLFNSGIGCKILRYGYHIIASGTSMTHAMVGIDRYRRICKSSSTQISVHGARNFSCGILVVAVLVALPIVFFYDSVTVETRVQNVSGCNCDIAEEYNGTIYPVLFHSLLSFCVATVTVTMIILYSLIGRKLYQRLAFLRSMNNENLNVARKLSDTGRICGRQNGTIKHPFTNKVASCSYADEQEQESSFHTGTKRLQESCTATRNDISVCTNRERTKSAQYRRNHNREMTSRKITITTFVIMVVYIGSFVPLQILELYTLLNPNIESELTFTQHVFYRLGFLTYAIDNMANPLIYLFMDKTFRNNCKELFHIFRCR